MKKQLLAVISMLLCSIAYSQDNARINFEGLVVNDNGKSIDNFTISLNGQFIGERSNGYHFYDKKLSANDVITIKKGSRTHNIYVSSLLKSACPQSSTFVISEPRAYRLYRSTISQQKTYRYHYEAAIESDIVNAEVYLNNQQLSSFIVPRYDITVKTNLNNGSDIVLKNKISSYAHFSIRSGDEKSNDIIKIIATNSKGITKTECFKKESVNYVNCNCQDYSQSVAVNNNISSNTNSTYTQPTEKRIALVIGIKNYRYVNPLQNTINDANAMERKLQQCGFDVIKRTDLRTADEIKAVINDFGARARNGYDVSLFFYSGHGINYNNESWIVPTDAYLGKMQDIPSQCANAGWVMDATSGVKNRIVIFDACRSMPKVANANGSGRDIEGHINGISEFKKGGGAFIAYATSYGETSGDGPVGGNGIYTGELLKVLDIPNLNILDVFSETATRVHNKTNGNQNPTNTSAFYSKFIFNRKIRNDY